MSQTHQQNANGESRVSLYDEVTERIVRELEQGCVPWVQPWTAAGISLGLPRSAATRKHYSGINILILWNALIKCGFASQEWLTFRQALALGGNVRKGERGTSICYADSFVPRAERQRAAEKGEDPSAIPFLKRFTVFNIEQCEGLPEHIRPAPRPVSEIETLPDAEALIAATGARFVEGGGEAFYSRTEDYIRMPPRETFFSASDYFCTAYHELGHWTAHPSRLARDLQNRFGSQAYAREELIAELCSAFLCAHLHIVPQVRHADYLGNWLQILRDDSRAIFHAASQASKAADFILAFRALDSDPNLIPPHNAAAFPRADERANHQPQESV
ncbi:MAG TPA: zincin-like metallopeptidase domain-containing protein [Rhizomicrobium sp.]|nr:zincin-like metallopeptidase domain-containing protein [Rhizomicrobium sp.]